MANEFCTGAMHIYVAPMKYNKLLNGINYLGTCESFPQRTTERSFKSLRNDLTSERSLDYVYAGGSEAVINLTLTRWDETVRLQFERAPVSGLLGADSRDDIGSLMGQEELGWMLYLVHQFGGIGPARPSMVGKENGRRYIQCVFWGPEQDETGTREEKQHMVFRAWKKYNTKTGQFVLWDYNIAGVPNPT